MKKRIVIACITLGIAISLFGCTSSTVKKAIEEGKIAVASMEYERALNLFKLAVDESKNKNTEAQENYEILDVYLNSKKLFENLELDKALELIIELDEVQTFESLQNDIKVLKENIESKQKMVQAVNEELEKVEVLIQEEAFIEAEEIINTINKAELSVELIGKIEQIKLQIEDLKNKQVEKALQQAEEEKNVIIEKGLKIIEDNGFSEIGFKKIVNEKLSLPEISEKELYYYSGSGNSPEEFYYNAANNKMYNINQGMWFIINENYKNVTPKDSGMYEVAEEYRNSILASKIKFSLEEAEAIAKSKEGELGLRKSTVSVSDGMRVVDGIGLYYASGETDTTNGRVLEFFVGSNGKLYTVDSVIEKKLTEL